MKTEYCNSEPICFSPRCAVRSRLDNAISELGRCITVKNHRMLFVYAERQRKREIWNREQTEKLGERHIGLERERMCSGTKAPQDKCIFKDVASVAISGRLDSVL